MKLRRKKIYSIVVQNTLFWTISFSITLNLFSRGAEIREIDWIYTFLFHIPFIAVVTLNIYQAIPNFLKKFNVWVYLCVVSIAGFGVVLGLYHLSYGLLSQFIFPDFYFIGVYDPLELFGIMAIYLTISTMIELSKSWFEKKEVEIQISQLEEERIKSELKALQAQINPHFLFNSLNTIYGEALKKSDKAPSMILKLSDILRYVVENMNKPEVQLKEEVEYIKKFVDLQKERLNNPNRVIFKTTDDFRDLKISPLLLITFIENAFKHGSVSGLKERILIEINTENRTVFLTVENNKNNVEIIDPQNSSGKGLENTKKRLRYIYPDKHRINIQNTDEIHKVELSIKLS